MKIYAPVTNATHTLQYQYDKSNKTLSANKGEKNYRVEEDGPMNGPVQFDEWTYDLYLHDSNVNFQNIKLYLASLSCKTLAIFMLSEPFSNGTVTKFVDYSGYYAADPYCCFDGCTIIFTFKRNSKGLVTEATAKSITGAIAEKVTIDYNNRNQVTNINDYQNRYFGKDFIPENIAEDNIQVEYDANHNLKKITDYSSYKSDAEVSNNTSVSEFTLNPDGTIKTEKDVSDEANSDGNNIFVKYYYNAHHLITKIQRDFDDDESIQFTYDSHDCATFVKFPNNSTYGTTTCTYQAI